MKTLIAALALLAAVACAPVPATDTAATAPAQTTESGSTPIDAAACAAQGGEVRPVCRRQLPACVLTYADAGKVCSDDADCQGKCIAKDGEPADANATVTGQCQVNSDPCGCRTEVNGGKARTICVD